MDELIEDDEETNQETTVQENVGQEADAKERKYEENCN